MDDPNIDGYETYCIGKMDAYCKELEAKNAELENQLKLSNEFVDIWRDKAIELEKKLESVEMVHSNHVNVSCDLYSTLEKKLEIAIEALEFMKQGCLTYPDGGSPDIPDYIKCATEALLKIKSEGL